MPQILCDDLLLLEKSFLSFFLCFVPCNLLQLFSSLKKT